MFKLDYIPRLMWQAQLRGNKSWSVAPTPECNAVCEKFTFYVEPGDAGKPSPLNCVYQSVIKLIYNCICFFYSSYGHSNLVSRDKSAQRRIFADHPVRVRLT